MIGADGETDEKSLQLHIHCLSHDAQNRSEFMSQY